MENLTLAGTTARVGAELYALDLLQAIGSGLSEADQEWLSRHLASLPGYLRTPEGAKVMTSVVNCFRAFTGD